jgi:hypothetical protein
MKRVLCTVAALMVATAAFAGTAPKMDEMTPEQAMAAMTNCPVCSVWMTDPALGPTIRHNIFATKTGYVEMLSTADAAMVPAFDKCAMECEKRAEGIPAMSKDQKAMLCPLCNGQMAVHGRADVTFENFKTDSGVMTVASSSTPDGVKALHGYAASSKAFGEKMAQAGTAMGKEPMKSKM